MKRLRSVFLVFALAAGLTACADTPSAPAGTPQPHSTPASGPETTPPDAESEAGAEKVDEEILIACFSHTGSTAQVADTIHAQVGGDLVHIETATPYPTEYNDVLAQAREEQDADFRPALATTIDSLDGYGTIFIGYPIWHGDVPMAILSFIEGFDWSGKTVIPFCTHGSGGAYGSFATVADAAVGAQVRDGFSIAGGAAASAAEPVAAWLDSLGLERLAENPGGQSALHITVGGHILTATLAENSSADALRALLADGPLTLEMGDYAGIEKVGDLGATLPTNDEQLSTGPGDVILYQGSAFVIYYGTNHWSLTQLGKIQNVTEDELREILGDRDVTITLSLE